MKSTYRSIRWSALLFSLCAAGVGLAQNVPVVNSSFESPALSAGGTTQGVEGDTTAVPGWTVLGGSSNGSSNAGIANGGSPGYSPIDGSQVAYLNVSGNGYQTGLATTSAVTTIASGTTYTLSAYLMNRSDGAANNGSYTVALTDNGQVVNPVTQAGSGIVPGASMLVTASYTPPASSVGHALGIKLTFTSLNAAAEQGAFDEVQLSTSTGTNVAGTTFSFTLPSSYTTSAGVYDLTGKLVRTLWRAVPYSAGTHTQTWDGHDDNGVAVAAGNYNFKILYHNVHYIWNGVIGNTSSSFDSFQSRHGINPIIGMAVNGTNGFEARGYNEGEMPLFRWSTTSPQTLGASLGHPDAIYSLAWNFVVSDGTKVYSACVSSNTTNNLDGNVYPTQPGVIIAYNLSDNSNYAFSAGAPFHSCPDWLAQNYNSYIWPNGVHVGMLPGIQGLAVQNSGNYLAISVGPDNKVYLLDKNSGSVLTSFTVTNPRAMAFDPNGDLWVLTGTSAVRYTSLSTTPTAATTITGFSNPLAVAVHPTNADIVLIADGGVKQQVRGFTHTGAAATGWSSAFGTVGGNKLAGPAVTNTKFWFTGGNDLSGFGTLGEYTYLAIASDGSFWLGDNGNVRSLHFSSARAYIEQISYLPDTYSCNIDANNPNRLFAGFLEYAVDYTKPMLPGDPYATGGNKGWKLVNNWAGSVTSDYIGFGNGLFSVATLSNGHTYCLIAPPQHSFAIQVAELSPTAGVRITNDSTLPFTWQDHFELEADGSIRNSSISGNTATWYTYPLTGFDANFNGQWGAASTLASAPAGLTDPAPEGSGDGYMRFPITSSNVLISLENGNTNPGMHLGGVTLGTSNWLWKASPTGQFDFLGTYDLSAQYAGNVAMASDHSVIYGYNGELGPGGESSQFMHFYDDGLFVNEFGVLGGIQNTNVGFAGNDSSPQLVKVSGEKYMWTNDENSHGGLHRWHLVGENAILEASATGAMNSAITIPIAAPVSPINVTVLPGSGKAVVSWSPLPGASTYTVKYSATRGGPYTTLSSSVTATTYTKTGLTNGTPYYFNVSASVSGMQSVNSNEVKVIPIDTTVAVQNAGVLYGGDFNGNVFPLNSANVAAGIPALSSTTISSDVLGNLYAYSVGAQGYIVYLFKGNGQTGLYNAVNLVSPLTVTADNTWVLGKNIGKSFNIDGYEQDLYDSFWVALAPTAPASTIAIGSPDGNWHCLTVYCPTTFNGPENYTISLTPQGLTTPSASVTATNSIYDGWHQFFFKGNATLSLSGTSNIEAIFLDSLNIAVTPLAPTGLTATAGTSQITLAWTTTPNATSYNIYRGTSAGHESTTAIATNVVGTSYVDSGLTTGTHYYYKIKAVNGVGTSAYSSEVNAISN